MHPLGLKTNIIGTLVFLLILAIFFSNIVVIMFWQRGLVEAEVRHVRSYLSLWSALNLGNENRKSRIAKADLDGLCVTADISCAGAAYFDMHSMRPVAGSQDDAHLARAVRLAAFSGKNIVQSTGASWGIFTFSSSELIIAIPLAEGALFTGGLGMSIRLQPVYQMIKEKQHIVFWYMLVNVLFLSLLGFFRLHRSIVRPIERLVKLSETYSGSEGQVFFPEIKGGEFGQLSMALNGLVFRIEEDRKKLRATVESLESANRQLVKTRKEMIRTEKSAAIGRLSAGLAHEIGNPIGIVQGYLELLQRPDLLEEEKVQFISRAVGELERISRLIRQLLDFSRTSTGKQEPVDVQNLLDDVIGLFSSQPKASSLSFIKDYALTGREVITDPDGLRQIVLNGLLNAADAIKEKENQENGKIVIACNESENQDGENVVRITITDNGMGIKNDNLGKIFDPFFTTKNPGQGTGLGLSVSSSLVEAAGGRIWVDSEYGKGTSLHLELPLGM
jgi:two-component system, NtrC family, sensor kinase